MKTRFMTLLLKDIHRDRIPYRTRFKIPAMTVQALP